MIYLKKLSTNDEKNIFNMLKGIKPIENSYTNPTYNMDYPEFKAWLVEQELWDKGENLPNGYVAQTIYWFYDDDMPIGMGKIRHELTAASRINGGNIGYAISSQYRGKGYGNSVLALLLSEAKSMGINEILLTVDKGNVPSKRVCEYNGGVLCAETDERWYFKF